MNKCLDFKRVIPCNKMTDMFVIIPLQNFTMFYLYVF